MRGCAGLKLASYARTALCCIATSKESQQRRGSRAIRGRRGMLGRGQQGSVLEFLKAGLQRSILVFRSEILSTS